MNYAYVRSMAFCLLVFILYSCNSRKYEAELHDPIVFAKTVKQLNDIVLENNFPPMIAARNYSYAAIAAYEIIAAFDSNYASLSGQIKHMPEMPRPPADREIDYPLAAMLAYARVGNAVTFPEGSMMGYHDDLKKTASTSGMSRAMIANSEEYAIAMSTAILGWAKSDNYAETRSASRYTVNEEEGRWIPTPPAYSSATEAHWMDMRTLVLDSASECRSIPPPKYDMKDTNSVFYQATLEVKRAVDNLTDEQKHIAEFWDDNPFKTNVIGHLMFATKKFSPSGHWMNIVGIAAEKAGLDFNATVYAYTKTSIALYDGFISCWEEKFRSNVVRPETVINKYLDEQWRPFIQTPPFPSYVSGHSVISAACAEVMTDIFGENFSFTDTSSVEFGIAARSFDSFRDASWEASLSRLYGGIHYMFDMTEGNKQGIEVGKKINERLRMRKNRMQQLAAEN